VSERSRQEAYEDGHAAFQKGEPLESNWYGAPSWEREEWLRGWHYAERQKSKWECGCSLCVPGGNSYKYCEVNKAWPQ